MKLNLTITWDGENLVAAYENGVIERIVPHAEPITAGSDSWAIAQTIFPQEQIDSVDHDRNYIDIIIGGNGIIHGDGLDDHDIKELTDDYESVPKRRIC